MRRFAVLIDLICFRLNLRTIGTCCRFICISYIILPASVKIELIEYLMTVVVYVTDYLTVAAMYDRFLCNNMIDKKEEVQIE